MVKDANGKALTESIKIRDRWEEYYQKLMNVGNPRPEREIEPAEEIEVGE